MRSTDLGTGWSLTDTEPGAPVRDDAVWRPVPVPGDVNAVLVRDGVMNDPGVGDQGRNCYWVTSREWWYRRELPEISGGDGGIVDLVIDGVDGHAQVFIDGTSVGTARNAFHPHRFRIDGALAGARHTLSIRFESIDRFFGGPRLDELGGWKNLRALMRKPQFSFGWDWSLPLPSIGIAGSVRLEVHDGRRLLDLDLRSHLDGRVDFFARTTAACRDVDSSVEIALRGPDFEGSVTLRRPGAARSYGSITVDDPKLWWPNGSGEQHWYEYDATLLIDGEVRETRSGRFAFRETVIEEFPFTAGAGPGMAFWLRVNGRRIFCKGANWIPLELWPATVTVEQYKHYIIEAKRAGFNMLRVWGGGIYERDEFYDLCDEHGIMVWQDFMFASTGYPVDLLRSRIVPEATYQIGRLKNHPCLAIWCGCNEDVFSWRLPETDDTTGSDDDSGVYSETGRTLVVDRLRDDPALYTMLLRGLVTKLAPGAPYVESSPQSYDDSGNMPQSGNSHLSSWKYALFERRDRPELFREHFDRTQSFDSEFCIQGPCCRETFERFMPEAHRWPPDDVWTYHIQRGHANLPHHEQTLMIAGGIFGPIESLDDYIRFGQATHVEMMRCEYESARRDRPNNGGTMVWMFNDCWPTSNWSIIDYYRARKPSFYAARRACTPVVAIVSERSGWFEFHVSNDGTDAVVVEVTFGRSELSGRPVWSRRMAVSVPPMDTTLLARLSREELAGAGSASDSATASGFADGDYLFAYATVAGNALAPVTFFPDGWRDVPWPHPRVSVDVAATGPSGEADGSLVSTLVVATDAYARLLHLAIDASVGVIDLADDYFDLPAGARREILLRSAHPVTAATIAIEHWTHHTEETT